MDITLQEIQAPIATEMGNFEKKFRSFMKSRVMLLDKIMGYIVKRKGKQMRPMFVFLSAGVTGLIEDVPLNSHIRFDALMSRSTLPEEMGGWGNFGVFTYVLFPETYNADEFYSKLETISEERNKPIFDNIDDAPFFKPGSLL